MALCRSTRVIHRPHRSGLTLLEMLAGLALLGTLASTILIGRGRALAQWSRASRRIEATRVTDELLTQWWLDRDMPINKRGQYDDPASGLTWNWQTRMLKQPKDSPWELTLVRLQVAPIDSTHAMATVDLAWPYLDAKPTP